MGDRNPYMIAMGANIAASMAENVAEIRIAIDECKRFGLVCRSVSSLWRTPAYPPGSGPDYVNACALIDSDLPPQGVLEALHAIESARGRVRVQRWGARVLDLDLLGWGDAILPDRGTLDAWMTLAPDRQRTEAPDRLILPHPRLHQRAFVLVPLAEVAPDWVHPVLGQSVRSMRDALSPAEIAAIVRI